MECYVGVFLCDCSLPPSSYSLIFQLAIYDPEGLDPQTDVTYREVKVSLQDNITATRKAVRRSWTSLKVCTIWSPRDYWVTTAWC